VRPGEYSRSGALERDPARGFVSIVPDHRPLRPARIAKSGRLPASDPALQIAVSEGIDLVDQGELGVRRRFRVARSVPLHRKGASNATGAISLAPCYAGLEVA